MHIPVAIVKKIKDKEESRKKMDEEVEGYKRRIAELEQQLQGTC